MVTRLVRASRIDFTDLRRELELPTQFPLAAQREADAAVSRVTGELTARTVGRAGTDRTDIPLVTIDPVTSRDLDQAVSLHRQGSGYRVYYAIADVAAFVVPGGDLDAEIWRRGQTVYLPDGKVPLHPVSISEGAASLLPGQTCPAVLWTIDVSSDGVLGAVGVERAVVRSRAKLDYPAVQVALDAGAVVEEPIALLPELGRLLVARGLERGAMNLPIPEQELEPDNGGWHLVLRAQLPVEEWNAQISLLTGMAAGRMMLDARIGLLRTMPRPHPDAVAKLRAAAPSLGVAWPGGASVGEVLAAVDAASPGGAAFVDHAAELMRGAGYTALAGNRPDDPDHGAVAAAYAHVTAPLRRLADRYATEVCLHLAADQDVPEWAGEALPRLPEVMQASDRRASAAERGAVDLAEAVLLEHRVGEVFDATVLDLNAHGGVIAIDDPPVRARCDGELPLGKRVRVKLVTADPRQRRVMFEAV
jgi:exoribonuclease R